MESAEEIRISKLLLGFTFKKIYRERPSYLQDACAYLRQGALFGHSSQGGSGKAKRKKIESETTILNKSIKREASSASHYASKKHGAEGTRGPPPVPEPVAHRPRPVNSRRSTAQPSSPLLTDDLSVLLLHAVPARPLPLLTPTLSSHSSPPTCSRTHDCPPPPPPPPLPPHRHGTSSR